MRILNETLDPAALLVWGLLWQTNVMTTDAERALLARIVTEPGKMGGKPIIRGRRITPATVLNMLAGGANSQQVLDAYPVLEDADIDACLLYAARLTERSEVDGQTVAAE